MLRTIAIKSVRVYVAGENLLTFTKYDGFDPEMASDGYTTIGVDRGIYPQARTITVGASPSPHAEILVVAKEILAAKDITKQRNSGITMSYPGIYIN